MECEECEEEEEAEVGKSEAGSGVLRASRWAACTRCGDLVIPNNGGGRRADEEEEDGEEKAVAREGESGSGGTGAEGGSVESAVADAEWYADERGCRVGFVRCWCDEEDDW